MEKNKSKKTNGSASHSRKKSDPRQNKEDQSGLLLELFIDELKDIYWAEKHLTKALPKMERAATSEELKNAFADHLEATKEHVTRLEQAFEMLNIKAQAKKCEAMDGLTKEGAQVIEDTEDGSLTRDVGLIIAAQKVEHYEIATYGSLAQLAKTLGNQELSDLMGETLAEEKEADELLTQIAENSVNVEATTE